MGREYFGDINGKFGFAIQSSYDIEDLIEIEYQNDYEWYGCNCSIDINDINTKKYCDNCYESYNQHYEEVKDEICSNNKLYMESSTISYFIYKENHYDQLCNSLRKIEKILPVNVIKEFKKIENNIEIFDGYSQIYNSCYEIINKLEEREDFKKISTLFCRYKLGFQIKDILDKQDHCFLNCEI